MRPNGFKTGAAARAAFWRTYGARACRALAIVAIGVTALAVYAEKTVSAYDVESAYLFNFGKFVRFSQPDTAPNGRSFDICIVGEDPLGAALDEITANERLDGKPVRVMRIKTAAEARSCAIAYISASEGNRVAPDLEALRGHPVLTVSDAEDFLKSGGMIQLIIAGDHVRFAVNLDAVRGAQLGLSSELLRVAAWVNDKPPAGVRP